MKKFLSREATTTNLCEDRLAVVCDNRGKITVQYDCRVVKRLLRMLQQHVELRHAAFKHAPEVPRDQRAAYCCRNNKTCHVLCTKRSLASLDATV